MLAILRPSPQCEQDRDWLTARGIDACAMPMLQINPVLSTGNPVLAEAMRHADILIFTSQHAVRLITALVSASELTGRKALCVGQTTAHSARRAGMIALTPLQDMPQNASALAQHITRSDEYADCRFLWLSAEQVHTDITIIVGRAGIQADRIILYKASAQTQLEAQACHLIHSGRITGVVALSRRSLMQFQHLLQINQLWSHHQQMHLFAASEQMLEGMNTAFQNITICALNKDEGYLPELARIWQDANRS